MLTYMIGEQMETSPKPFIIRLGTSLVDVLIALVITFCLYNACRTLVLCQLACLSVVVFPFAIFMRMQLFDLVKSLDQRAYTRRMKKSEVKKLPKVYWILRLEYFFLDLIMVFNIAALLYIAPLLINNVHPDSKEWFAVKVLLIDICQMSALFYLRTKRIDLSALEE
jgi:uncharacterized membrane protein